jgi:hypothetical protein
VAQALQYGCPNDRMHVSKSFKLPGTAKALITPPHTAMYSIRYVAWLGEQGKQCTHAADNSHSHSIAYHTLSAALFLVYTQQALHPVHGQLTPCRGYAKHCKHIYFNRLKHTALPSVVLQGHTASPVGRRTNCRQMKMRKPCALHTILITKHR